MCLAARQISAKVVRSAAQHIAVAGVQMRTGANSWNHLKKQVAAMRAERVLHLTKVEVSR